MRQLIKFQEDRKLNEQPYKGLTEHTSIVEELLESIGLDVPKENRPQLKRAFQQFVDGVIRNGVAEGAENIPKVTIDDQVDAYCDIITFCTGAILKLGHNPIIAIKECGKEINSRVGEMVDGKFEKDLSDEARADWYSADYGKSLLSVVPTNSQKELEASFGPKLTDDEVDDLLDIEKAEPVEVVQHFTKVANIDVIGRFLNGDYEVQEGSNKWRIPRQVFVDTCEEIEDEDS